MMVIMMMIALLMILLMTLIRICLTASVPTSDSAAARTFRDAIHLPLESGCHRPEPRFFADSIPRKSVKWLMHTRLLYLDLLRVFVSGHFFHLSVPIPVLLMYACRSVCLSASVMLSSCICHAFFPRWFLCMFFCLSIFLYV